MIDDIKLENCPFCGSDAEAEVFCTSNDRIMVKVMCTKCRIGFSDTVENGAKFETLERALMLVVEQWNDRVTKKKPLAKWIPRGYHDYEDGIPVWDLWECSHCGYQHNGKDHTLTKYCPDCGYGMYGGENHVGADQ